MVTRYHLAKRTKRGIAERLCEIPLDQRFFLYYEDYDLCARPHIYGYQLLYFPDISIMHMTQRDSHRSMRHFFWHTSSLIKIYIHLILEDIFFG
jgi:GT2 family glycosyltransferase